MADHSIPQSLKGAQPHHAAWLKAHPGRMWAWLQTMISDGFDIHHVDKDRKNNDPNNLILIDEYPDYVTRS
jgi:hypothetical protein